MLEICWCYIYFEYKYIRYVFTLYIHVIHIYMYIYVPMKTMCPPGYHHNGFVATHALGYMWDFSTLCVVDHLWPLIYIYIIYIYIHIMYTYIYIYIIYMYIYISYMYIFIYMYKNGNKIGNKLKLTKVHQNQGETNNCTWFKKLKH